MGLGSTWGPNEGFRGVPSKIKTNVITVLLHLLVVSTRGECTTQTIVIRGFTLKELSLELYNRFVVPGLEPLSKRGLKSLFLEGHEKVWGPLL